MSAERIHEANEKISIGTKFVHFKSSARYKASREMLIGTCRGCAFHSHDSSLCNSAPNCDDKIFKSIIVVLFGEKWTAHSGGKCPVPKGTLVDVKFRDNTSVTDVPAGVLLKGFCAEEWSHSRHPGDIVMWRLHAGVTQ